MSREALSIPPLLAFADPRRGTWGVAAGEGSAHIAVGQLDAPVQSDVGRLEQDPSGGWTVHRDGDSLIATRQPAGVVAPDGAHDLQLIQASGSLLGAGGEEAGGGVLHPGWPELKADSVRLLFAWFSPAQALALAAVRPAKARGQDRDEVSVACIGEPEGLHIFDPRLSSTYGEQGLLRRLGVELWLGESEEADLYSLRVAGEVTGSSADQQLNGISLRAQPFLCHCRGAEGVGVYVLIGRS